ncbi:hypothetical protein ACF059_19235 [Streptomyces sp. NPDC016562]|uniref:hypothetical protein n=1 Tax=Streptomyces sp. NPDC016562 TaxID=3364966 RepID=UPI0036F8BD15
MAGTGRTVWVAGGVCGLVAVGLVMVAVFVDLDTGDRTASIAGAVIGLAGCLLSIYFGTRGSASGSGAVRARGRGAVAAGGSVSGNAVGKNAKVTRTANPSAPAAPAPAVTQPEVTARGAGAVAAGTDVTHNAIGEGSQVEER